MQWMPIETAPKDRPILLYLPKYDSDDDYVGIVLAYWHNQEGLWEDFCTTRWYGHDENEVEGATHWAEKPATPDEM